MKATDQLSKTEEGLQNTRAVIESQQKLIASQEETIKQIVGGDGMPRVLVKVMDNYDAFMYEVKIGLINEDKYPIPNVQASVMDFDEISPKQSHDPRQQAQFIEEFLTSSGKYQQTVSLAPWSAHVLRTTVLKFVKPYQIYFVDVSWLKGKYDIMFRLILKDYVPAIEILRLSEGNVTVKESERDKFYLLGSDIFQRAQGQKAEIESRIEFERSKVPIFKF